MSQHFDNVNWFNLDIYTQTDNKETLENPLIVIAGDEEDDEDSQNVKLLNGLERR